ncbi:MAG TPA: mercuric reductase [Methylomirabilota bacterium]|nr:mercuric reductase [Methylomirabilota bacterium]
MSPPPRLVPDDVHNRTLVQNVHPPGWRNPQPARRYHLVVVGAGTAGLVTAAGAAGLGARVALVERHFMGGDCLVTGCVPSKAVIRSSRVIGELRDAAAFGVKVPGGTAVDFGAVMERMRRVRAEISPHDSAWRFSRELGVDVFLGEAAFTGPDALAVDGRTLRFARAVIATGARPGHPPIPGLAEAGFLTSESVFDLTERPSHLAVVGGGPIGCELAQAFCRLGAEVTLLSDVPQLLPREDPDAAEVVRQALLRDGVRLVLGATIASVAREGGRKVLRYRASGPDDVVAADEILVATGRVPNVEGMGLEAAGVRSTREGVVVDDHLRTTNSRIYAAGDVCLRWKFTHAASAAARIVVQNALFGAAGRRRASRLVMPRCTYTDPEVAHVGWTERETRDRGVAFNTLVRHLGDVDRARTDGETEGFVKVHLRRGTGRIVGATIVAPHAGEMVGELTLAMTAGIGLGRLAGVIHPYPTQAEAVRHLADQYQRTRLTPFARAALGAWLRWIR